MSKYSIIAPKNNQTTLKHFGNSINYIKAGSTVLDVGCSTGYYGKFLINTKSCLVDGIEINQEDMKLARKVLGSVFVFDLDEKIWPIELTKKKYDVIYLGDVIEHMKQPDSLIMKLVALLEEDGVIIISTPNIAHISIRLELMGGDFNYERTGILDNTHLKYFTLKSLLKMVSECGLDIIDIDYTLADLMPDLINDRLKKIGLNANKKFWKLAEKPESRAYQYIVVLKKSNGANKNNQLKLPTKPLEDKAWYIGQLKDLNTIQKEQRIKISSLEAELNQSRHDLALKEKSFKSIFLEKIRNLFNK